MEDREYLYIVKTFDIRERTDEEIEKEFECLKVQYDAYKNKTIEEYRNSLESEGKLQYAVYMESSSYHKTEEDARYFIEHNIGGLDDGCFNYAAAVKIPFGIYMGEYTDVEDVIPYVYNRELGTFELISDTENIFCHLMFKELHFIRYSSKEIKQLDKFVEEYQKNSY